eukprot:scaffold1640_cov111-Isochrysis_galbana.AAC.14
MSEPVRRQAHAAADRPNCAYRQVRGYPQPPTPLLWPVLISPAEDGCNWPYVRTRGGGALPDAQP